MPRFAVERLRHRTLMPASELDDFIGLTILRGGPEAFGRFFDPPQVQERVGEGSRREGCSRVDFPCRFRTIECLLPPVFESEDERFAAPNPSIAVPRGMGALEAMPSCGEVTQTREGDRMRGKPCCLHLRVF